MTLEQQLIQFAIAVGADIKQLRLAIAEVENNTITNLDLTNQKDGSVLVYSQATDKWEASTELTKQSVVGGQY